MHGGETVSESKGDIKSTRPAHCPAHQPAIWDPKNQGLEHVLTAIAFRGKMFGHRYLGGSHPPIEVKPLLTFSNHSSIVTPRYRGFRFIRRWLTSECNGRLAGFTRLAAAHAPVR